MAQAGQELHGPGGYVLRLVRTAAETGGELLEMEAAYGPESTRPPEHLHPRQDERFEVLEGTIWTSIAGEERRYEAGATFDVPAGTPHRIDGPESAREAASIADFLAEFADEIRFTAG